MEKRIRGRIRTVVVIVIPLAAIGLLTGLLVIRTAMIEQRSARQRLVRLLSETDHEILLDGCRELSTRVAQGTLEPGSYSVRLHMAPEARYFPQVILALEPACVRTDSNGRVIVEMFGYPSYGVVAYPEGYNIAPYDLGDVELIPGLWYYHEDYDKYEDYRRDVNSLLTDNGDSHEWRSVKRVKERGLP